MTAATRSNRAAPMTVARAGREGAPIPVTPTFSSRTTFGSKESSITKAMNITTQSPLVREVRVGPQPAPRSPFAQNYTNPERAQFMNRIKVDVPYTGSTLLPVRKTSETPATKNRVIGPITVFEKPQIHTKEIVTIKPAVVKEPTIHIPDAPIALAKKEITIPTPDTVSTLKEVSEAKRVQSLSEVRTQLQTVISAPRGEQVTHEHILPQVVSTTTDVTPVLVKGKNKMLSPVEMVIAKNTKKAERMRPANAQLPMKEQPSTHMMKENEIQANTEKDSERALLAKYLETYIMTLHPDETDDTQKAFRKEIVKRMTSCIITNEKKDGTTTDNTRILGDLTTQTVQEAMKKIEALVAETRVKIQIGTAQHNNPEKVEQKELLMLHMKIQEAGLLTIFTKIQSSVIQEIAAVTIPGEPVKQKLPTEDELKTEKTETHPKIELDTFADRLRRVFMKSRAQRAFDKAKERGQKMVTTSEIAKEIGTYQYQFIKSKPVRYTKIPDGSITETLAELHTQNIALTSIHEAEKVIDAKIDQKAPVRITQKVKTQRRGLLDLLRVFGYQEQPKPKAAFSM